MILGVVCRPLQNLFDSKNLSQGGENALKKVSLAGPVLHPFLAYVLIISSICLFYQHKMEELNWLLFNLCACRRSYTDVLESFFEDKLLISQQLFASEERYQKILDLIPDESKKRHHMNWTLLSDVESTIPYLAWHKYVHHHSELNFISRCC